jgi:subtilisin-like proprotein convertase family protein
MKIAALIAVAGLATVATAGINSGPGGAIPDRGEGVLTSSIAVSGDTAFPITSVSIVIRGFTHTWIGDLSATLTSPSGSVHTLFSRVGLSSSLASGDASNVNGDYTFADGGADLWAAAAATLSNDNIPTGTYRTSSGSGAATSINAAFAGQNSNGIWTLTIADNEFGDVGAITGWELTIVPAPSATAVIGLGGLLAARRRR